jgi:hypothetical protein
MSQCLALKAFVFVYPAPLSKYLRHKKKEVLVAFLLSNNKPSIALLVLANENIGRIEAV